jgi:hypothetical protein
MGLSLFMELALAIFREVIETHLKPIFRKSFHTPMQIPEKTV